MGKRSSYKQIERDFYPTPAEAILPLLPHIPPGSTFNEPCAGDGALVRHLEDAGVPCIGWSDIEPQDPSVGRLDVFDLGECAGHMFITNPPWSWPVLDPLIDHLSTIARTWLLLNADLMHNKRMAPHMARCSNVASIGRVQWFGNQTGMENSAWYCFERSPCPTIFHARGTA